jgi:serine/threonine-protein kinase
MAVVDDIHGDISIAALQNERAIIRPLVRTPEKEQWAELSPDGRWLAYGSNVSGRFEVWVKPYPTGVAVPVEAGGSPAWHPNGRELFFLSPRDASGSRWMMAVDFTPGSPRPAIGQPRRLFEFNHSQLGFSCVPVRCYDVAPDGQRFYVTQALAPPPPPLVTHLNLITDWFEELKAKVPPAR